MNLRHTAVWGRLAATMMVLLLAAPAFAQKSGEERIVPGPGVTAVRMLREYHPSLKGTPGDTPVYVLDSGKPGGTLFVMGGTHGNEPSGYMSAILMVENAVPAAGRVFIIPHANASAINNPSTREGAPKKFTIKTPGGERTFRYGSRLSNPAHQALDPANYQHPRGEKAISGDTARNLNRLHPGKKDGYLTEQVAYGIAELIRKEKADMAIDLHEANPDSPIKNVIIAHDRAMDIAAETVMNLEMDGIAMRLDGSPQKMWGLSHREWGDQVGTLALLMETINPAQGPYSDTADENLIVFGRDGKNSLAERVARHTAGVAALLAVYNGQNPQRPVVINNLPSYTAIKDDMGKYLLP